MKLKRAASRGELEVPAADVTRDDLCTFGKWLKDIETDPDVQGSAAFEEVQAKHTAFHKVAGQIAAQIEAGQTDAASKGLDDSAFKDASAELASALYTWKATA